MTKLLAQLFTLQITGGEAVAREIDARLERAQEIALTKSANRLLALVRSGFREGGIDPVTGAPGFWPERKVPDIYLEGVLGGLRAGEVLKAAVKNSKGRKKDEYKDAAAAYRKKLTASVSDARKRLLKSYKDSLKADKSIDADERKKRIQIARERKIRVGGKLLNDTGDYYNSISASEIEYSLDGEMYVTVGTMIPYAKFHEQPWGGVETKQVASGKQAAFLRGLGFAGARKGSEITLPARRVFVMPDPWRDELAAKYQREFQKALKEGS